MTVLLRGKDSLVYVMFDSQIDVEKSIARRWLSYQTSVWSVIDIILEYISRLVTLAVVPFVLALFADILSRIFGAGLILVPIVAFGYLLFSFFLVNRLVCVGGSSTDENRRRIIQLVGEKFPKYKVEPGHYIVLATHDMKGLAFDRTIVFLFDDYNVYINAFTLGRGDIKYLAAALPNYLLSRKLAREFCNLI